MSEEISPAFQQNESVFAGVAKNLVIDLVKVIGDIEERLYMEPEPRAETRGSRLPYKNFRRVFKELLTLTHHRVHNKTLVDAIRTWLKQTRYNQNSREVNFETGIKFAEQYIDEMYKIGILDMNISDPVDFPFEDILEELLETTKVKNALEKLGMEDKCQIQY